ncbi:MAG: glycoside hydrolase family 2 TIM barrel-domain containing protein [Rikenellaceae bacterium]
MRRLLLLLGTLLAICTTQCYRECDAMDDINQGWSFMMGDMDSQYYQPECDSSSWDLVDIPHDWSIIDGYTQEHTAGSNGFLPGGVGWYRKSLNIPESMYGKNIAIRFEAIYNNSQVWINGHDLGNFPNGYLDFEYDLTPYITKGENIITVRVDRRAYADARWYVGGGIYRPVHIIVREDLYIPTHGVMITTPSVTAEQATVNVVSEVQSVATTDQEITIEQVVTYQGAEVTSTTSTKSVKAGERLSIEDKLTVPSPKLWSMESPNIYELQTTLLQDGAVIAQSAENFGIKTMSFDPERGFILNGKSEKIKGVNLHHDLGCVGVALHDQVLYRRLKKLQDMGVNAIRTAHNPHSESMMAMCDTMGLLVMNEFIDEWRVWKTKWIIQRSKSNIADSLEVGYSAHFDEIAERDLKNFIRRDYNHPSIILWSIGNEIEWTYPYYFASSIDRQGYTGLVFTGQPEKNRELTAKRFAELSGGKDELAETAHLLAKWVKEVDTTRPVTSGVVIPSVARVSGYTDALDVIGYNYKDTYYETDFGIYPDKAIFGSENVGQYYEWRAVMDKPYISGIFLWTGVDYIGENGPWPAKCGSYSLFDVAGLKSPRGHFFETLWLDTPKTHIVTTPASMSEFKLQADGSFLNVPRKDPLRKWMWFETFDKWKYENGEEIVVQIYTNAPKVELKLNGESLGVKSRADFAEENIILWQIPYQKGELTAIGVDENGKEFSKHTLKTYEERSQLACSSYEGTKIKSDGVGLAHIEVELQDANGTLVSGEDEQITITCDSKSRILGVDNGSETFVGDHQADNIVTHNGRALVIIQPLRGASGDSKITLSTKSGVTKEINLKYYK